MADATQAPTRLVVVDDDVLVRSGLSLIFEAERDLTVVGQAGTGREALDVVAETDPDVVIMDVRMPDMDGVEATGRLVGDRDAKTDGADGAHGAGGADGRPRVLVLTTFEDQDYLYRALRAGASGFLLKRAKPEELVHGVRVVASGTSLVLPDLTRRLIADHQPAAAARGAAALPQLTAREVDVLRLVAAGLSNAEIAERLFLSAETVKTHLSRVLVKVGARDRTQAVIAAYESGFVSPAE
ncbi:response regulator transcription factor [Nocardioides iriomotensis]|uniref:Response regulator transcription factor n=1 Tax=Nocardioides iriomotensis TaxID=715784 RepID=A0A4Q5JCB2_9ACTN|nr:response regulator transcription factor [Nocardioides iriomotensis]RYU15661.1 response regulator transcription factor [Nocardioides iriomotensis]